MEKNRADPQTHTFAPFAINPCIGHYRRTGTQPSSYRVRDFCRPFHNGEHPICLQTTIIMTTTTMCTAKAAAIPPSSTTDMWITCTMGTFTIRHPLERSKSTRSKSPQQTLQLAQAGTFAVVTKQGTYTDRIAATLLSPTGITSITSSMVICTTNTTVTAMITAR